MVDLVFGSKTGFLQNDSMEPVINELEGRGRDVERITRSDINPAEGRISDLEIHELDDIPVLYRRNHGFQGDQVLSDLSSLTRDLCSIPGLDSASVGPNILPHWDDVRGSDNKQLGKKNLQDKRVPFVPTYDQDTAKAVHEAGQPLMEKPEEGSLGEGVRPVLPEDDFSPNPDRIYEPLINHYDPDSPWVERRAVGFAGKYAKGVFAVKDRELKSRKGSEDFRPKNISSGNGKYSDLDPESSPFDFEDASFVLEAIDANGGGMQGVDYLYNRETGQRMVIETNNNVGFKGIRKASEEDIDSYAADLLEKEIDGEVFYGMTENLEEYSPDTEDQVLN